MASEKGQSCFLQFTCGTRVEWRASLTVDIESLIFLLDSCLVTVPFLPNPENEK